MSNNKKQVAQNLRALADLVERTELKDYDIKINQFSVRKDDLDGWAHYIRTGDLSVQMNFDLYSPETDERGSKRHLNIEANS